MARTKRAELVAWGKALSAERERRQMKQGETAKALGFKAAASVCQFERGKREPAPHVQAAVERLFGVRAMLDDAERARQGLSIRGAA